MLSETFLFSKLFFKFLGLFLKLFKNCIKFCCSSLVNLFCLIKFVKKYIELLNAILFLAISNNSLLLVFILRYCKFSILFFENLIPINNYY